MRKIVVIALLWIAASLVNAQQPSKPTHQAPTQQAPAANPGVSAEDAQTVRDDLQRMKSLVQQMQTNLAYVTSIQGPLKHQFELEIEMWQLEIARMERHLDNSAEKE